MAYSFIDKVGETITGAFIIAACIIFRPLLRPWYSKWGAIDVELTQKLPGDEYAPSPRGGYTQAISIKTSANLVWPWLVQVGQGMGGFYSYELLENIVGCNIHNADQILPEYQNIKIGDRLIMHPKAPAVPVAIVEPERVLVYGGRQDENTANVWIFFINDTDGLTRVAEAKRKARQIIDGARNKASKAVEVIEEADRYISQTKNTAQQAISKNGQKTGKELENRDDITKIILDLPEIK